MRADGPGQIGVFLNHDPADSELEPPSVVDDLRHREAAYRARLTPSNMLNEYTCKRKRSLGHCLEKAK